mmetsp:Transcript_20935/g.31915  ORF Transcript_20935/g.31915 Transcript_20935/m.31915 type:complete len:431 (+) Transcript_20935:18-1310(+)
MIKNIFKRSNGRNSGSGGLSNAATDDQPPRPLRRNSNKSSVQRSDSSKIRQNIQNNISAAKDYKRNGQFDLAHDCLKKALSDAQVFYGDDVHPRVTEIRELMGDYYSNDERHPEALEIYTSLLQLTEEGTKKYKRLQKKETDAMDKVKEKCKNRRRNLNIKSVDDLQKGLEHMNRGEYDQAKISLLSSLGATKMNYGINHNNVVMIREHLGDLYLKQKQYDQGRDVFSSVLMTLERTVGPTNFKYQAVLKKLNSIPKPTSARTRSEESIIDEIDAVEAVTANATDRGTSPDKNSAYAAMIDLKIDIGVAHMHMKRFDEADEYLASALEALQSLFGDDNMQVATVQEYLGDLAMKQNNLQEAQNSYQRAALTIEDILGKENPRYTELLSKRKRIARKQKTKIEPKSHAVVATISIDFAHDFMAGIDQAIDR